MKLKLVQLVGSVMCFGSFVLMPVGIHRDDALLFAAGLTSLVIGLPLAWGARTLHWLLKE